MFPVLQVGPLAIQTPGLLILLGLWLGIALAERYSSLRNITPNFLSNMVYVGLIAGIIGGRIIYSLRYSTIFLENPISLISLNPGLFSAADGVLVGVLAAWVYTNRKQMPLFPTLDACTPLLAVFGVVFALAHLASGTAYGAPTQAFWAIHLWGTARHPSQVYEFLAAVLILIVLWPARSVIKNWRPGSYFLGFIALSSAARLFLEAFRGDSILIGGGFRLVQIYAWFALVGSLTLLRQLSKGTQP